MGVRERWADSARGLAVTAVVLGHVFLQESPHAQWALWGPAEAMWVAFRDVLLPVRMPLFFLVAGYFAAHVLARPWRTLLRTRTFNFYWVYVVWLAIHTALFAFVPHEGAPTADSLGYLAAQLSYAPSNLWFLIALAVAFVLAKAGARAAPAVLAASGVVSWFAFADQLPAVLDATPIPEYLVFFLLGAYVPGALRIIRGNAAVAVLGFVALALGVIAMKAAEDRASWTVLLMVSTCAGVVAVVSLLKLLDARDLLPRLAGWLGRRTLPIYVAQMPLVVLVDHLIRLLPDGVAQAVLGNPALSTVYPLAVTALVISAALGIHAMLHRRAPWLYRAPWLTSRATTAAQAPPAVPRSAA